MENPATVVAAVPINLRRENVFSLSMFSCL
jgi:hypothetical protein